MRVLFTILAILTMSIALYLPAFAQSPCKDIVKACTDQGYYKGGNTKGKGLVVDCILPITEGSKTIPGTNFSPSTLKACREKVMEEMGKQD